MTTRLELRISSPPGPGPHPVLCFLHGYDEAAPVAPEVGLTRHGPLSPAAPPQVRQQLLVIAPQLPFAGDVWHRFAGKVRALLREAIERHGGDGRRAYLTGFSFGANGVFDLALEQPGTWAALWPVDPTRVPVRDPQRPVWLSFGEVARPRKHAFLDVLALERAALEPSGERLYVDEGDDHVGAARRAYSDWRIYCWLLRGGR